MRSKAKVWERYHLYSKQGSRQGGSTSIEVLSTMLLLLLLGIGVFSLALTSTAAYKRLYDNREASAELRVGLSFIQMKIRQNDMLDGISLKQNPINQKDALVIREYYESEAYDTWIYYDSGILRECLVLASEEPSNELSFEIAHVDGLNLRWDDDKRAIAINIWKNDSRNRENNLQTLLFIRSGQ